MFETFKRFGNFDLDIYLVTRSDQEITILFMSFIKQVFNLLIHFF